MATLSGLGVGADAVTGQVTRFIVSQNIGIFTAFSLLADYYMYIILPLSLIFFYRKLGRRRVASLVLGLLLLYFLVPYLKVVYSQNRPCDGYLKAECPKDYSFPSGHTAVAFAFAFFSVGTAAFPFYYLSAFLIALSRIYLGVHVLNDIIGGVVAGIFSYYVSEKVVDSCLRYAGD